MQGDLVRIPPPHPSERQHNWLAFFTVVVGFMVIASRLLLIGWRYSVNLIFWDQWDFYEPLFQHQSLWRIFVRQHGPPREGIGLVIDKFVLDFTHWNSRAEVLLIVVVLIAGAVCALQLKRKLFGELTYPDLVVPALFLTLAQAEGLLGPANPSYSAFPLLMIALYCLAWLIHNPSRRYGAILILNFLLIYTGFGFFMGEVTVGLLVLDLRRALLAHSSETRLRVVVLALGIASLVSFFVGYYWAPAHETLDSHVRIVDYPWFVALMFSFFLGIHNVPAATVIGGLVVLTAVVVLARHAIQLWHDPNWHSTDVVMTVLTAFSLLFAVNAAIGRVSLGMPAAAQASRYMGLLVPAFLAMYFELLSCRHRSWRTLGIAIFLLVLLPACLLKPKGYALHYTPDGKRAWKQCYLRTENIDYCDQLTDFPVYPPPAGPRIKQKLEYLKRNRLNLYAGAE